MNHPGLTRGVVYSDGLRISRELYEAKGSEIGQEKKVGRRK